MTYTCIFTVVELGWDQGQQAIESLGVVAQTILETCARQSLWAVSCKGDEVVEPLMMIPPL